MTFCAGMHPTPGWLHPPTGPVAQGPPLMVPGAAGSAGSGSGAGLLTGTLLPIVPLPSPPLAGGAGASGSQTGFQGAGGLQGNGLPQGGQPQGGYGYSAAQAAYDAALGPPSKPSSSGYAGAPAEPPSAPAQPPVDDDFAELQARFEALKRS